MCAGMPDRQSASLLLLLLLLLLLECVRACVVVQCTLTREASWISTIAASLPLNGPSLTRTTRPFSTSRLKVPSDAMAETGMCVVCV